MATRIARDMVMKYGMSAKLGNVAVDAREDGGLSSDLKSAVESEVKELLNRAYTQAKRILENNRDELDALAKALLEQETLSGE